MPRALLSTSLLLCCCLALSGCPRRIPSPTSMLEEAAQEADAADASARTLALAGFHHWLLQADPKSAARRLEAAHTRDPKEPWALYGQHLMELRLGRPAQALERALLLVERAPSHPLAAAAARFALGQVGTSPSQDDLILAAAGRILQAEAGADAAHLLRSAKVLIHRARGDETAHRQALAELSVVEGWSLLGPFSAYTVLEFHQPLPPEQDGQVDGPVQGALGALAKRTLRFPDGRASLVGEPAVGNLYVLAADLVVQEPGEYVLRAVSSASHRVSLGGQVLFERARHLRAAPAISAQVVALEAGRHRLVVVLSRDESASPLTVSILRPDGSPSGVRAEPAAGPPPRWERRAKAKKVRPAAIYPGAKELASALEPEVGAHLAAFVAVRDGMARDPDGARRVGARLLEGQVSPALLALRAELWLSDPALPSRVAVGRASRDLEAAVEGDLGHAAALLRRAELAQDAGRQQEAQELLALARAAAMGPTAAVPLALARLDLALGLEAQADQAAQLALKVVDGHCEALALRYDLARRREAAALSDELVGALAGCPGAALRRAEHLRWRGEVALAVKQYEALYQDHPGQLATLHTLVGLYLSLEQWDAALERLSLAMAAWPRNAELKKRAADVHQLAGRKAQALALREQALELAGGDLALRRRVHQERTGQELLQAHAIDGDEALRRYQEQPGPTDAHSVLVLDAAAVEAFADGSRVERTHIIQRALTQDAVSEIGEVRLPPGAQVLQLRTLKQDGTSLEPEDIEGKDTISMPGVQVGDYVQYEYLEAISSRGPAQPGFTAPAFYFRIAHVPNVWASYTVVAPRGEQLLVDAHNLEAQAPVVEQGQSVFRQQQRHVAAYLPEPNAPPVPTEYLPWVQAGAGATGNEGLVAAYADAFLDRARLTYEVEQLALEAALGKKGEEAARAVHREVMRRLQGRDAGLAASAAWSVAQERGSRLWTLKAALEAVGIPTRVAAVRTFNTDPAPYLFPNEALVPYVALRAELPGGRHLWLDPAFRFGVAGRLPEQAEGQQAWLFPEPGRPAERTVTPRHEAQDGKRVTLVLELDEEGTLRGEGEERYEGFESVQLSESLEQLPPDRRRQALQGALARYFTGAELEQLEVDLVEDVGQQLVVRYRFFVPAFARKEGERWVLGPLTFPVHLGRRYVQLGRRATPLFVEGTERTVASIRLTLPEGRALEGPLGELKVDSDFGHFARKERQKGRVIEVEEDYRLQMARIPPDRYEDFAHFAGQVDLLQSRDLLVR